LRGVWRQRQADSPVEGPEQSDGLFDAVWEALVVQIVAAAPVDVNDLPGFAARLYQTYADHPELARLITWQRLERGDDPPHDYAVRSSRANVDAIARAQSDGLVSGRFDARVLYALILHTAALWGMSSPDILAVVNLKSQVRQREIVRTTVAALLA
jgi:hypothetical protein